MGATINYAADLIPEISDDIINIDRAMRWGFAWSNGPFEILDALGPLNVVKKLEKNNQKIPKMLKILSDKNLQTFYNSDGTKFLNVDGEYEPIPVE